MGSLDGQVAIITGCGRLKGLGRGIAHALAGAGAAVVATDVAPSGIHNFSKSGEAKASVGWKGLDSLVEELNGQGARAMASVGDVSCKPDAERMVAEAVDRFGQVDILVNNAAAPHGSDRDLTWKVSQEAWEDVLRVNATGTFLMSTTVVRHLLDRQAPGRIINIGSPASRRGYPQLAAYCASKFAIIGLTQSMAAELASFGITVNAVCPAVMDTESRGNHLARAAVQSDAGNAVPPPPTPVGRLGVPEDVARAVLFLAEPAASYITGESLNVNGGFLMI